MALQFKTFSKWKEEFRLKQQRNRLITQLRGSDQDKWEAAKSLLKTGWIPKDPIEKVWLLAASGNWEGVSKLGRVAVEPLVVILLDGKIEINTRKASAKALDQFGWEPQDRQERKSYLLVSERWNELVKMGTGVKDALLLACNSENSGSRWRTGAIKTLGEMKAVEAVGFLTGILQSDRVTWEQAVAAEALLRIGDSSVIEALSEAFKRTADQVYVNDNADAYSHYVAVRDACANALAGLGGETTIARVCDIICECGNLVNSCGHPRLDDVCSLHWGLGLGEAYLVTKGIEVLERIGGRKSTEALKKVLTVRSQSVRSKAQDALDNLTG